MIRILFILLFIFLSGCVSYPEKVSNNKIETCQHDGNSQACWKIANNIQSFLKGKFSYISQDNKTDTLISHLNDIKKGKLFNGDCDDFAYTGYKMALDLNIPKSLVKLSIVKLNDQWHMITKIGNYAIDNRYSYAEHLDSLPYNRVRK